MLFIKCQKQKILLWLRFSIYQRNGIRRICCSVKILWTFLHNKNKKSLPVIWKRIANYKKMLMENKYEYVLVEYLTIQFFHKFFNLEVHDSCWDTHSHHIDTLYSHTLITFSTLSLNVERSWSHLCGEKCRVVTMVSLC